MKVGDAVYVKRFRSRGLGLVWATTRRRIFITWPALFVGDAGACVARGEARHVWWEIDDWGLEGPALAR